MSKDSKEWLEEAITILERVGKYGPHEGTKRPGIACAFCDMGGAGYSFRGDGHHDDACAVKDAQIFVRECRAWNWKENQQSEPYERP